MPPKQRARGLKVKTGCITCKIRRVKCDEAKPYCNRCTNTGRKCDGYLPQGDSRALISSTKHGIHRDLFEIPGTAEERRGFHYFRDRTAPELAGYFTEGFWDIVLLQRTMSIPALRYAVVAFGALHEKFASGQLVSTAHESSYLFAMQQYSRAVMELRKALQTENLAPEVVLITSILFTSFDSLRGNFDTALLHMRNGLSVLRNWINNPDHSHADRLLVEKNIRPLFVRLGLQAIIFADNKASRNMIDVWADVVRTALRKPNEFTNLNEARLALETYVDSMTEFFYSSQPLANNLQPPDEVSRKQHGHAKYFRQWGKAFDDFLVKNSPGFTGRELRAASILKIQHLTSIVMVESSLYGYPAFEKFGPEFQTIVNLSRPLIAAESKEYSASFSPEMGVIAPLYFTALKCQVQSIKLDALRLLRASSRREGMWDSTTEAQIAQRVLDLEMAGSDFEGKIHIPLLPDVHHSHRNINCEMATLLKPGLQAVGSGPSHHDVYQADEPLRSHGGTFSWHGNQNQKLSSTCGSAATGTSTSSDASTPHTEASSSPAYSNTSPAAMRTSSPHEESITTEGELIYPSPAKSHDSLPYRSFDGTRRDVFEGKTMALFEYSDASSLSKKV